MSNDNYRDLVQESCEFKKVVAERVLMYSFVNDHFMPPDDPLGRSGPTLDNFLRIQPKYVRNEGVIVHLITKRLFHLQKGRPSASMSIRKEMYLRQ